MLTVFKTFSKGLLLCAVIALPSWFLGKAIPVIGGPVFGILFGMIITSFLPNKDGYKAGIGFTSKKILQYAVILLGFNMNLSIILKTGQESLPIILATITTSLLVSFILYKLMNLKPNVSILIGVGSSICGGSAIAATAPIIDANNEDIATSISVIFLFNVIAALIFPSLGYFLGLSNEGFGLFTGTAVNDTSSVTAAAAAWDGIHNSNTLKIATIVKLTRTLAIIPITLGLAMYRLKNNKNASGKKFRLQDTFPMFILYFLVASIIATVFNLSVAFTDTMKSMSKYLITMAMSAIGLNTNFIGLIKTGSKPILLGFACWISITVVSLLMQKMLGIW